MTEHMPGGAPGDVPDWEELRDEEIDPGIREDLLKFAKINEAEFWSDEVLETKLKEDPLLPVSLFFGYQTLINSHKIKPSDAARDAVLRRYNEAMNRFLSDKLPAEERILAVQRARQELAQLGFSEKDLSAKETLKRAYLGTAEDRDEEALAMLKRAAGEDPGLKRAMEEFERAARDREEHEKG
ncbi:MAG: hypothetical protein HYT14_00195 [Candidatus Liptonbacteria bacterium]|nr:hypothetical protein [Candidatus Liptonbacteria bacterium]